MKVACAVRVARPATRSKTTPASATATPTSFRAVSFSSPLAAAAQQHQEGAQIGEDGGMRHAGAAKPQHEQKLIERDAEDCRSYHQRQIAQGPGGPWRRRSKDTRAPSARPPWRCGRRTAAPPERLQRDFGGDIVAGPAEEHQSEQRVKEARRQRPVNRWSPRAA